jgi:hypothetical protein
MSLPREVVVATTTPTTLVATVVAAAALDEDRKVAMVVAALQEGHLQASSASFVARRGTLSCNASRGLMLHSLVVHRNLHPQL